MVPWPAELMTLYANTFAAGAMPIGGPDDVTMPLTYVPCPKSSAAEVPEVPPPGQPPLTRKHAWPAMSPASIGCDVWTPESRTATITPLPVRPSCVRAVSAWINAADSNRSACVLRFSAMDSTSGSAARRARPVAVARPVMEGTDAYARPGVKSAPPTPARVRARAPATDARSAATSGRPSERGRGEGIRNDTITSAAPTLAAIAEASGEIAARSVLASACVLAPEAATSVNASASIVTAIPVARARMRFHIFHRPRTCAHCKRGPRAALMHLLHLLEQEEGVSQKQG